MKKTKSLLLFSLKIEELKKTANYLNTAINESYDLIQQYPSFIVDNKIFDIDMNVEKIASWSKSIEENSIKLIFLTLIVYFEEFINSIILEIISYYKVGHIKHISNIVNSNYDKRYEFLNNALKDKSINKNYNDVHVCIIIRNNLVHNTDKIKNNKLPNKLTDKNGFLVLNKELLKYTFTIIESETQHLNNSLIKYLKELSTGKY